VAINTWPGYAPGLVENGGTRAPSTTAPFYRDHGIQVELVLIDDFAQSRDAFRAGRIDVLWATVDSFALEAKGMEGMRPRAFLQFDYSAGGDAIAATGNIRQVSDLRGKRVAYAEGTPSQFLLLYALTNAGLSMSDITPVTTASAAEAATLFRSGSVEAAVSWDPDVVTAANSRPGGHILVSTREADHIIADVFYTSEAFLAEHGETLARFSAGWFDGVRAIARDREAGARALSTGLNNITPEDARAMLPNAHLSTYWENRKFFGLDGGDQVTFTTIFTNANRIWRGINLVREISPPDNHFAVAPLEALREMQGRIDPPPAHDSPRTYTLPTGDAGGVASAILTRRVTLQFPTGVASLDDNEGTKALLERVEDLAASFGGARMRITGNTDNVGNPQSNRALSRRRAEAIRDYLVSRNFDSSKFEVVGAGFDYPVCSEDTEQCRARNRRTDFEVIPEGSSR
jgi:NitT/TauT family transport system substrate-binding protein